MWGFCPGLMMSSRAPSSSRSVSPCRVFECHFADQRREDCHHHYHTHPFSAGGSGDQVRHGFGYLCYFQANRVSPGVTLLCLHSFSVSPQVALMFFFSCFGRNITKPKPESQFEFKPPQATQVRAISLFPLLALCFSFQLSEAIFTRYLL